MLPEIWHQINIPFLVVVLAATAITMGALGLAVGRRITLSGWTCGG